MDENQSAENTELAEAAADSGTHSLSPILTFRLAVVLIAAAAAAVIKMIGGTPYDTVKEIYLQYAEDSIVTQTEAGNGEFIRAAQHDFQGR